MEAIESSRSTATYSAVCFEGSNSFSIGPMQPPGVTYECGQSPPRAAGGSAALYTARRGCIVEIHGLCTGQLRYGDCVGSGETEGPGETSAEGEGPGVVGG